MAALIGNHNIEVYQGADFSYVITIKDDTGTPINLTGSSFSGRIREEYGVGTAYDFTFTPIDLVLGKFKMSMSHVITSTLGFSKGVYEVDLTYSDGTVDTFLYGNVVIRKQV